MFSHHSGTIFAAQLLIVFALQHPAVVAQEAGMVGAPAAPSARVLDGTVPRLIKFSGVVHQLSAEQRSRKQLVGLTFALYQEQEGGEPLWQETQNVKLYEQGRYSVFLGATGELPLEVFTSAEAHWLGIRVEGGEELPRVLLVSVPYALKAADADTLGGKPASAYLLAETPEGKAGSTPSGSKTTQAPVILSPAISPINGEGTPNRLAKYTADAFTIGDSMLSDDGTGLLQFAAPTAEFRITNTSPGTILPQLSFYDGATLGGFLQYRTSTSELPNTLALGGKASDSQFAIFADGREKMRVDAAGQVGIGTTTPESLLHLEAPYTELRLRGLEPTGSPQVSFYDGPALGGFMQYRNSGAANPNIFSLGGKAPNSQVAIFTHGAESVRINANGNVGIGITNPGQKLSVAGMIESTAGGFKFPDGTVQTTKGEGAVTSVAAGTGLIASPSPITGSGTLSINTSIVPRLNVANTFTAEQTFAEQVRIGALELCSPSFSAICSGEFSNPPRGEVIFFSGNLPMSFQVHEIIAVELLRLEAFPSNRVVIGPPIGRGPAALLDVRGPVRTGEDVQATTAGSGLVVKSPDGTMCARIGINNSGTIAVTSVTCPL